jgi:hypothetical protein
MIRIIRISVACLCLSLYSGIPCHAKEWRDIVPLHSTRSDVIKLLGEPTHLQWDYRDYFILDTETVTFQWIDPTCKRKFPVEPDSEIRPDDLVLNISVTPKKSLPEDELRLPPLKLYLTSCIGGANGTGGCIFMDNEEGFAYSTSKDGVTGHSYGPPAKEYETWMQQHSACRSSR